MARRELTGRHLAAGAATALAVLAVVAFGGGAGTDPAAAGDPSTARLCEAYSGLPDGFGDDPTAGMVRVAGGTFTMGDDDERPEERPAHPVTVSDFLIDTHEVTNAQFRRFVEATGYVTIAERGIGAAGRGRLPEELTRPGSMVFSPPTEPVGDYTDVTRWWRFVEGANWRAPYGPGSSIDGLDNRPVVHVTVEDAYAYAKWVGRRLPTEAEWEFAARGGLDGATYAWGESPGGEAYDPVSGWKANTWQGAFPAVDDAADGHHGTAPVGCYAPNGYGLHDVTGNVWEFVQTWWLPGHVPPTDGVPAVDPLGPLPRQAIRFGGPLGPNVVVKGGSWLCAPVYCARYRPSARQPQELALGANHIGFRTARDPD